MKRGSLFLAVLIWVVASCAPVSPTPTAIPADESLPILLTPAEVKARLERGGVIVLDVREPQEWTDDGHIEGAVLIPLEQLPDRFDELNPDDEIILVCRSGSRSAAARAFLSAQGFSNLHELRGGMRAWAADGLSMAYGQ